jgi:GABA(A) receptor-associated protein
MSQFKKNYSFDHRLAESEKIMKKYPGRVPVIIEKDTKSSIPNLDKTKFLVPLELTIGQLLYVIRKRIKISPEKAIFMFISNILPPTSAEISTIYEKYKDEDGFLYCTVSSENTFGNHSCDLVKNTAIPFI